LFIQTEQTPNPSTLKFLPGRVVMEKGTMDFAAADAAHTSPLAKRLFAVEGVERVFFGADFVTVTKSADKDWQVLKPSILGGIMEHYTSGEPVIAGEAQASEGAAADDDEVVAQIKELLETRVRPAVAQDGGDIIFQLPATVREMHRLCRPGTGVLSVVIPCEGSLAYSLARKMSAQRIFEKRYEQPYDWFIRREHLNRPGDILAELEPYFHIESRSFFPVPLPLLFCNLCVGLTLQPRART